MLKFALNMRENNMVTHPSGELHDVCMLMPKFFTPLLHKLIFGLPSLTDEFRQKLFTATAIVKHTYHLVCRGPISIVDWRETPYSHPLPLTHVCTYFDEMPILNNLLVHMFYGLIWSSCTQFKIFIPETTVHWNGMGRIKKVEEEGENPIHSNNLHKANISQYILLLIIELFCLANRISYLMSQLDCIDSHSRLFHSVIGFGNWILPSKTTASIRCSPKSIELFFC